MSYMDRKNILSEGFFDNLKKLFKRQPKMTKQDKELMKDPEYKKAYVDALKSVNDTGKKIDALMKKRGIK